MNKLVVKLTFIFALSLIVEINAAIFEVEKFNDHLRWKFKISQDVMTIKKINNVIKIQTLNVDLFSQLSQELKIIFKKNKYISDLKILNANNANRDNNIPYIEIKLSGTEVEMFSFYMKKENKQIVDFWIDDVLVNKKSTSNNSIKNTKIKIPPLAKKAKLKNKASRPVKNIVTQISKIKKINPMLKDFRYGAPFIWDYEQIFPQLKVIMDIKRKTPEFFYAIDNRKIKNSEMESHLQLNINLYREEKWGLMYKSIKLFEKKYGAIVNSDVNEYLKVNALLRDNFKNGNEIAPVRMAINILLNILGKSNNYEMRRAINKYLIAYYLAGTKYIKLLDVAKTFYIDAKENYDYEELQFAAECMLYSLAHLGQYQKIVDVANEKTIQKIVPGQILMSYKISASLKLKKIFDVITEYEKNGPGLLSVKMPSMLYNVAEAYFRDARFEDAIKVYDRFLEKFSHHRNSDNVRARLALAYEILDKDYKQTLSLYEAAINRSQNELVSYEARMRYVALRTIRNKAANKSDFEVRTFLDQKKPLGMNKHKNLKKLLWLVRLRSFIVDKNYYSALSFLTVIPFNSMPRLDRRVFVEDGAEIVYGVIQNYYKEGKYSNVIKVHGVYKNRYVDKVANDPFMNYLLAKSYLNLNLFSSAKEIISKMKKLKEDPVKTFPIWVKRIKMLNVQRMILSLNFLSEFGNGDFKLAAKELKIMDQKFRNYNLNNYYHVLIENEKSNYKNVIKYVEKYLSAGNMLDFGDIKEVARLMDIYTSSLYQLKNVDKFKKVATALLGDTAKIASKDKFLYEVRERIEYLLIETLFSEKKAVSYLMLESQIDNFNKNYPKSDYSDRMSFLKGMTMLENKKENEGIKILKDLLNLEGAGDEVKELARSELSLIKLRKKIVN